MANVKQNNAAKLAFVFTGQGSQYFQMGLSLFESNEVFKKYFIHAEQILSELKPSLSEVLFYKDQENLLKQTLYTQTALFVWEYALAKILEAAGIVPAVMIGHSIGEYVARALAGAFSFETGLKLVFERAQLMQALPQNGTMFWVKGKEDLLHTLLKDFPQVEVAAYNAPELLVLSGPSESVLFLQEKLKEQSLLFQNLEVSHAFHSSLMEPVLKPFENLLSQIHFRKIQIPVVSNVNGKFLEESLNPNYLCQHLRQPVLFRQGINFLEKEINPDYYIEIGPKASLSQLIKRILGNKKVIFNPNDPESILKMTNSISSQSFLLMPPK